MQIERTKKWVVFLGVLFLGVFSAQCAKRQSPIGPQSDELYGYWTWKKSVGGFAGETRTPESTGYTQGLVFEKDGICKMYRDDTLVSYDHYVVVRDQTSWFDDSVYVIRYTRKVHPEQVAFWSRDSLELVDLCIDCYWHTYTRNR